MPRYFLGVDIGSTKSHACIADETGTIIGFGTAGAGNHEVVGYEGMKTALVDATHNALAGTNVTVGEIAGAGFGIAGFDWPTERTAMLEAIAVLGLDCPLDAVNDAMLGVIAGSAEGWGIAVVSGTGCNCRGRTRDHLRQGMVTGAGLQMGEGAGASELVQWAVQALAHMWSRRGPRTALAEALIERAGARDLEDLIEGIFNARYDLNASAAPLVLETARRGDPVANALVERAGHELGELANAVIRQLDFQIESFDIVLIGSMFSAGEMLIRPLRETVLPFAPGARFVKLESPPVLGAVLLGMEQGGLVITPTIRRRLDETMQTVAGAAWHARGSSP
jgi:N-acetylglucosamine kinase-like BadF-type ATPase